MKKVKKTEKKKGIGDRIIDLLDVDNPTVITLYGKPGTGKTTIAASLPKPILFIDVKDKGTDSAKSKTLQRGQIKVLQVTEFDEIYDTYDYIKDNPDKFKSIVIDHMTALQDQALEKIKGEEGKEQISQRMFGMAAGYMKEIINLFKDLTDWDILPCFLVQDRMESGEGEGEDQLTPEVGPGLMPSLSRTLCASSRIIGHTYLQEKVEKTGDMKVHRSIEYRLRLGPNPYYITKVTRPKGTPCPPFVVNATYSDIEKIIKGNWEEEKQTIKKKRRIK